ncbi:MAG: ABC transporter permease [Chloroflexota bacterium]
MREFFVLVGKELKAIRREKTIMFAIFIQLFIAAFSSFLLVGVMSFYDPGSIGRNSRVNLDVAAVGATESPVIDFVESEDNIHVKRFLNTEAADQAFRSGRVDAVMSIPETSSKTVDMQLVVPESDTKSTLVLMTLDTPLKEAENYLREQNGIELSYNGLEGEPHTSYEFLYSIIIPLLMFFPALIAGSITIDTISEEFQNKTLDTLQAAPLSLSEIFLSKVFAAGLTALVQCVLWVLLLRLNDFSIQNVISVLLLSVLVAICIAFGAAIIALHLRDRERAQFVYSIALVVVAGLTLFVSPSPFGLMTRLAAGGPYVGMANVLLYIVPIIILSGAFLFSSKRLEAA